MLPSVSVGVQYAASVTSSDKAVEYDVREMGSILRGLRVPSVTSSCSNSCSDGSFKGWMLSICFIT
jgi:hypothetical protein